MQTINYQKQATDFLKKTGVQYSARFKKYGIHFLDDKDERDIFACTLRRDGKSISFKFGQSINDSTGNGSNKPTAYDLLTCITKSDPGNFNNFCGDFGYSEDSRGAEKIYKACVKEWDKVSGFFSEEEIEQLQEIN